MSSAPLEFEVLADWVDGRLDPERAATVAAQVDRADARTRALVDWLRGIMEVGRALPLEEVPAGVRQRLAAHFVRWRDSERALAAEIRRFDTTVLFDSRARPDLVGVRGVVADEADDVVHLAYTCEAADVVLDVHRLAGHRARIDGQVFPAEPGLAPDSFTATASGPGAAVQTAPGDRLGRFRLDVVEDVTQLELANGEIVLSLPIQLRRTEP